MRRCQFSVVQPEEVPRRLSGIKCIVLKDIDGPHPSLVADAVELVKYLLSTGKLKGRRLFCFLRGGDLVEFAFNVDGFIEQRPAPEEPPPEAKPMRAGEYSLAPTQDVVYPCQECGARTVESQTAVEDGVRTVRRRCTARPLDHVWTYLCWPDGTQEAMNKSVGYVLKYPPECGFNGCPKLRAKGNKYCSGHEKQKDRKGEANLTPLREPTHVTPKKVRKEKGPRDPVISCGECGERTVARATAVNGIMGLIYRMCAVGHRGYYTRSGVYIGRTYTAEELARHGLPEAFTSETTT